MIRRLRQQHLRMALVLAIVVPLILILGLLTRRPAPVQPIPPELVRP